MRAERRDCRCHEACQRIGLFSPLIINASSDPKETALIALGVTGIGAAIGFVAGTVVGWQSGVERARDEYLSAYATCMRERGYTIIRERR